MCISLAHQIFLLWDYRGTWADLWESRPFKQKKNESSINSISLAVTQRKYTHYRGLLAFMMRCRAMSAPATSVTSAMSAVSRFTYFSSHASHNVLFCAVRTSSVIACMQNIIGGIVTTISSETLSSFSLCLSCIYALISTTRCTSGCRVCQICNREAAGSNLGRSYFVPRSTQPSILPG